jgi:molecular chaperone HtpG
VQRNPAVHRIQKALVGKLLRELEELAKDEQAYGRFWQEFGIFLKEGIATDPATKDELLSLLRFHSSQEEQAGDRAAPHPLASLAAVKARMHDDQQAIVHSPHLDYFRANDIEVLYLVDPIDSFMMMTLAEFEGVPLKNIDDASLELPTAQRPADAAGGEPQDRPDAQEGAEIPQEQFDRLIARFVQVLGDKVTQVRESKILRASPCRLVSPESTPGGDMQRVYRMLNQEYEVPKKILEINRGHVLIQNLARRAAEASAGSSGGAEIVDASILDTSILDAAIEQLYENQLLVEGLHPNPAAMIERIQALMEAATAGTTVGAAEDAAAQE